MVQYYESVETTGQIFCQKCGVPFEQGEVKLAYMGNSFPVQLPMCPICKMVFIPSELALGKILRVEKSLEDK